MKLSEKLKIYEKSGNKQHSESVAKGTEAGFSSLQLCDIILSSVVPGLYTRSFKWSLEDHPFTEIWPVEPALILELVYQRPIPLAAEDILFIDTETTGLSRGAGTICFLYGLSWIENNVVHFEQFFLTERSAEKHLLDLINQKLYRFTAVATYNGKSFDLPIIRNRMILNRERLKEPIYHFDLYHIWKRLLGRTKGMKQSNLEVELLDMIRDNDLPGSEVPQIYFDYSRYGRTEGLDRVLIHNELDLKGLTGLFLKAITEYNRNGDRSKNKNQKTDMRSAIAKIYAKNKQFARAAYFIDSFQQSEEFSLNYNDGLLLAFCLRKTGDHTASLKVYKNLYKKYRCLHSASAVARNLEWKQKDFSQALSWVENVIQDCEANGVSDLNSQLFAEFEKRRTRLSKKL